MKAPEFRRGPKPPRLRFLEIGFTIALVAGPVCGQAQTEIACGQTISGSLLEAGQTNSYTFSANAGEAVAILTLGQSFNAVAEVFDSAGARLGAATNDFTAPLNLTNTGAYTIGVHADNSTNAGPYGLSLTFLTGRCGAPLIWGLPATNTLKASLSPARPARPSGWKSPAATRTLRARRSSLTRLEPLSCPG